MTPRLTNACFVAKAKAVWGDRFDYSQTNYLGSSRKITIRCPEHGEFIQLPTNHLAGALGCKACRSAKPNINVKTQAVFIKEVMAVWGDHWDLSKVNYVNNKFKVTLVCPEHGEFEQLPKGVLSGATGCKQCKSKLHPVTHRTLNTNTFIQLSKAVWGDRFDYSRTLYHGSKTHVTIRCRKHGEFQQLPYAHLEQHCGCKVCVKVKEL